MATPSFPDYSIYFPDPVSEADSGTAADTGSTSAPARDVRADPDFREVRRAYREFGPTKALIAVGSFLLYVLLSCFAPAVMNLSLLGNINLGLVAGLLQFVIMGATAYGYTVHMRTRVDPIVDRFHDEAEQAKKIKALEESRLKASAKIFGGYRGDGHSSRKAPGQAQESVSHEWRDASW